MAPPKTINQAGFSKIILDISEAMSIKFNTMVYELRRQGRNIIVLSLGEADFDIPLWPMDVLPYPASLHYSHSRGIPELRECLAHYYKDHFNVPVDPGSEILVTAGSKAAIYFALLSVLNHGDEVLVPEPGWVSYPEQIRLCGGVPVGVPFSEPVEHYREFITSRTKAMIITSPHNPRGYAYNRSELSTLLDIARERAIWVFSDEAYSDFVPPGGFISAGALDPQKQFTVVFNSVSKNFGMSGWRLGYVIARPELISQILKVNQHIVTCPATILEYYVAHYFDAITQVTQPQIGKLIQLRRETEAYLAQQRLQYLPGNSTFYFFISIDPSLLGSEEFCRRLLMEKGVCVVPGVGYGASCDRYVRLSIGTETKEKIFEGIDLLKLLITQTRT